MNSFFYFPTGLFIIITFILQCVLTYLYVKQMNANKKMKADIKDNNRRIYNLIKDISLIQEDNIDTNEKQSDKIKAINRYIEDEQLSF